MLLRRHRKPIKANEESKNEVKEEINYKDMTVKELKEIAKEKEIEGYYDMKKDELIKALKG